MKNLYRTALPLIVAAAVLVSVLCVGGIGATAAVTDTFVDEIVDGFNYDPVNGPVVDFSSEGSVEQGAPGHRLAFEQNFDLERTLMLKQDNDRNPSHTEYIVYKMAKNICGFELDAVVCAGLGDILEDLSVFISKTGAEGTWAQVQTQATMYEYDEDIYLGWDRAYWFDTTVHNAAKIPVGYKYLKIQFNACNDPYDIPWNVAVDTVKIRMGTNDPVPVIPADKLLTQTWDQINASRDANKTTTNYYPTNSTTASTTNPGTRPTNPAPDANAPAFAMDSVTALAGQTVTVPLRIVHNPGIIGMRAIVTYDPAVLTPTAMEAQDFVGATFGPLSNPLSVIWFDALNPDNTTDGVVALCTFTVAEDAPAGEYPLLVSIADPDDNYNAAWQTVEFATIDGSVRVVDYVAGDANSDGKLNVRDLGLIQQYLNGWDVEVHLGASDVTGDGKVNVRDLGRLQQYLNGWDVTLEHGSGNTTSTTIPSAGPTTQPTTAPTQAQLQLVTDQEKILADAFALGKNETTPYIAQLTGMVTSIDKEYNDQHGSISVWITVGGQRILCYNMKGSSKGQVKEGDTITVTGVIKNFYYEGDTKGKVEFTYDPDSNTEVQMIKWVAGVTPNPTLSVVANPQVGVAYKFGFESTSDIRGGTYYAAGGMNGFYMATTQSSAAAIDVYLENANGGYYLYTMVDGKKQYMNLELSGTHINAEYSDTPGAVFTYDTAKQTLVVMIEHPTRGEGEYAFGTYGDYITIGSTQTDKDSYFCHFYA